MAQGVPDLSVTHPTGPWLNQEGGRFLALHSPSPSPRQVGLPRAGPIVRACRANLGPGLTPSGGKSYANPS